MKSVHYSDRQSTEIAQIDTWTHFEPNWLFLKLSYVCLSECWSICNHLNKTKSGLSFHRLLYTEIKYQIYICSFFFFKVKLFVARITANMNSMKLVIPLHFISWKKRLQTMLWHHNARVNSHQRWKQTRFRICFHLWCELTITMNVTEWQVSWNSCSL